MKRTVLLMVCLVGFCRMSLADSIKDPTIAGSAGKETFSWEQCIKEASRNNPDLIAAGETVYQAVAAKAMATSGVFPQINANAGAGRSQTKLDSQKASAADSFSYGVSGSVLLFDGLTSSNSIKAAGQNVVAAREAFRFSSASVRWQLRTAFVGLLKAQELVLVTQDIARIREDELKLITLRYKSGLEHRGALLSTQASMTQAKFDLEQAVRNLDLSQRKLSQAMGRRGFVPLAVREPFTVNEDFRHMPDFKVLAEEHPSLKQALAQKNSADFAARAAGGNYYPQISVQAGANKDGSSWAPENRGLNTQLVVSVPLFEGGLRKAQLSKAESALRQAEAQLRSVQESTRVNLEQSWESFREAAEAVETARAQLAANDERSKIAEAQYSTGFITYDDWTIIEDNIVQSKKNYLNAQANALLAEANWNQAKGETLEYAHK